MFFVSIGLGHAEAETRGLVHEGEFCQITLRFIASRTAHEWFDLR